ncbi:RNA polymerase subunit sigma-70 [Paenibacillus filicis]|uniref:RNA polymerase subunit sigma-70 n=1 Tax=Paenibacillus filicis TaxID=669464 RepID=A0ABU9DFR1_9BACL
MRKVTEDDVLQYYLPLVQRECKHAYKGLDWEDRVAEGNLALLHAIRTYRTKHGYFKEYAASEIRRIMQAQNGKAWSSRRLDSRFSLDAFSGISTGIGAAYLDDSIVDVTWFMESLAEMDKIVVCMLMEGMSIDSISDKLVISQSQVQGVIEDLKQKLLEYFGDSVE